MTDLTDKYWTTALLDYRFVEFLRLDEAVHMDQAASAFMGQEGCSAALFKATSGIDLTHYKGFYVELGFCDAPTGPLFPGEVGPILALRASRRKMSLRPSVHKIVGYLSQDRTKAWVDAEQWDELLGDDLAKRLKQQQEEAQARQASPPPPTKMTIDGVEIDTTQLEGVVVEQDLVKLGNQYRGKK